jgi:ribosomal-protein-alanine N-acetyltransferase
VLEDGALRLRPIALRDKRAWRQVRERNRIWLSPWDATVPPGSETRPRTFGSMVRSMQAEARSGRQLPFVVEYDGRFAGQVTVNNITRGSGQFASIGYWIDEAYAGRGLITTSVAMVIDHCFFVLRLHRVEIAIRPENKASLRVVEKLGIAEFGFAPRFLHIDGDWRDHRLFAITREECPQGMVMRLKQRRDVPHEARESQQSQE